MARSRQLLSRGWLFSWDGDGLVGNCDDRSLARGCSDGSISRRLFFASDVDLPVGQTRREANVLSATTNRERELVVGHDNIGAAIFLVELDRVDLGRAQRIDDEGLRILVEGDDVDLLGP